MKDILCIINNMHCDGKNPASCFLFNVNFKAKSINQEWLLKSSPKTK